MRKIFLILTALMLTIAAQAQIMTPVHFSSQLKTTDGPEAEIIFTATIDPGWHVYSTDLGQDGPIEATFFVNKMEGAEVVGKLMPKGNVIKKYDTVFGMELKYFENKATFVQKIKFTKPQYDIDCYLEYGACNDESCLPPGQVELKEKGNRPLTSASEQKEDSKKDTVTIKALDTDTAATDSIAVVPPLYSKEDGDKLDSLLWAPVTSELQALNGNNSIADKSLFYILMMGFVGGLLAVCMPCIWPIIPMTVSFFLKRAKTDKSKGVRDAVTYGLSIIVIYLGLGICVTTIFGSDSLNAMSTNAVFNVFLFLLLVIFALSFFGWFEIKLPDSWANAIDSKASTTSGLLSIFLMAFTLVLVSFSCTAPIIGLLLVEATTSGNWAAPAMGMLGFAVALALPFTIFALFPSWLKQAPKSGSWMTTIKVVLGFIELAFALKFLSVADQAYGWHILDREVFISLWIIIFGLLGAYLCGWLKFQEDEIGGNLQRPMPVACIMGGLVSLAFAVYMLPGLWGAPCKAISAFAPPMNTQDFNLNTKVVEAQYTDYEKGMAAARAQGKPVLLDFTGFGCVNCRKMEASVWTDPQVAQMLTKDFVLISLYVDDKARLTEPIEVTDQRGNTKTLRSIGAKWSWLQSNKFGANAQPFYVILDPETAKPLTGSQAYNEDINAYINFLKKGLANKD
ncbi:MAG: thioredoxin family protein [Prevotella sp.]|nr:thioredoxin family protein [Prevotella sp.]